MNRAKLAAIISLAWIPLACSNEGTVDIGEHVGAKLSDYAASWDGYAEAYTFDDGSDRVRLVLAADGTGSARVGDKQLYAAASEALVAYPPGDTVDNLTTPDPAGIRAGFAYPAHDTRLEESRIRLGLQPNDPYAGWCALQTPYYDAVNNDFSCYRWPELEYEDLTTDTCTLQFADGTTQTVSCAAEFLCQARCACSASGCGGPTGAASVEIDAALDTAGTSLVGTLSMAGQRITIRLHKN